MQRRPGEKEPLVRKNSAPIPYTMNIPLRTLPSPISLEKAKSVFPIFGGTGPVTTDPATTTETTTPSGGTTTTENKPEVVTPEQAADLLKQVTELTGKLTDTQTKLSAHESEKEKAQAATRTKEENLQKDLETVQKTVAQMDAVIQHLAKINAIQAFKDAEFHSARHVLAELGDDEYQLDVDLEGGTATVTGMERALQRVMKDSPWLVSKNATEVTQQQQTVTRRAPGSGAPPAPPTGQGNNPERRSAMIGKFSAIGGRR